MKGRPQDCMRVGMIHFMAYPQAMKPGGPVVETLRSLCADDYFSVVEATRIADAATRKQAIETVRQAGRDVFFGAQPALLGGKHDLNSPDTRARQAAVDVARACLAEAVEWNALGLAVLSGPVPAQAQRAAATSWLAASLKELCEFGRRQGNLPILLETFDQVPFGKNCLIGPTADAVALARHITGFYPSFGLLLDLSHLPLQGESAAAALGAAAPFLKHVHIGNCVMRDNAHPAYGDNHPIFGCPGGENGVQELAVFLRELFKIGYLSQGGRRTVSFEIKPYGDQTSEQVLANAKETLDAAWKLV